MSDPLLITKINLPVLRHTLVPRQEVLKQLSDAVHEGHSLTLISAPAGYGKTTTVRMWLEELGKPVAWVSLEESDNNLKQFLTYVLTALQQGRENLGQAALEVVETAQDINLQHVLGLLINNLYALEQPNLLVLEDYHLIENPEIDRAIELLLNQATSTLCLVITTREDPNLPLARLRVRNQITEIRAADLRFSLDETSEFFSKVMGISLSENEIEILASRTEGWIAGLQLAALSLKESQNPTEFVEAFRGTHRHVLDYLIEEVLNGQTEEVRQFLRQTSILDQLSPSLCEAVTGQEDSKELLRYLESNNLFLVPLDEERTWYRYHALFSELLQNQLLQTEPEQWDDLHKRASDWYQENGYIRRAVEHAFQISDRSTVLNLIEEHAIPMLYQGEVSTVVDWFDRLPEPLVQCSPMMCISKAWSLALMQRGTRRGEVQQALQAAEKALDQLDADVTLRNLVAGHAASIQALLMQSPVLAGEKPEKLIETSQKAQQLLPEDEKAIRSVNALNIGYGYTALADLPAAERAFKQTLEEGLAGGNLYAAIYGPIGLILIAIMEGRLGDALQLCERNIERFNKLLAGQSFPPIGALYILKGSILLEGNRLAEAEPALTQGLDLVRWTGEYEAHMKGFSALARLRAIQGDWPEMLESLGTLEETWPEGAIYAQALRHRLSVRYGIENTGKLEEAHTWLTQAGIELNNLPDINGVDPVSETYFQTYLSVAHILTRLAKRNPQAYPLQDVHNYLARQEKFAEVHGLVSWLVEISIVRALLYQATGLADEAHNTVQAALKASAQRGYFRIFVDEGDPMRSLLEAVKPYLTTDAQIAYANSLLEALRGETAKGETNHVDEGILSDRELEVLRLLAAGLTYKEIGQQLFLSLNTVQFHIKSIYRKLTANKRVQAIEKAREMNLI